jgi:rare lipoprotein A
MRMRADKAAVPQLAAGRAGVVRLGWRAVALACCVLVAGCASVERPLDAGVQSAASEPKSPAVPQRRGVPAKTPPADPPSPQPAAPEAGTADKAAPAAAEPESPPARAAADQVGLASWYGGKFHRRRTASGELFDMRALTAAHPTLPFGSLVCVRSTVNGRTVVVRINDRGPHTGNRVIDLSRAAAEELGMIGLGLKPVELFTLQDGERECPEP